MLRGEEIASQLSIWWGMKFQNHADHAIFVFCTDRSAHLFCEKLCNIKSETGGGFCVFHGIEPMEELTYLNGIQTGSVVGESHTSVRG